jgi:zinc transporter, ZIP family
MATTRGYSSWRLEQEAIATASTLAAGGLLAMLTNSLMPFAYDRAGSLAGVATVVGFCASLVGS